jgi:beta-RFAP synthase
LPENTSTHKPSSVKVTTTARLHFGFLDPSGRSDQPFGSFGLSLDQPLTRLTLEPAETPSVSGPEGARAGRYLMTVAEACGIARTYRLEVTEAIPPHAGLGSGTQLALAVGAAFAAAEGLDLKPLEIAGILGRGARSGIGMATFEVGGAVLDTGPRDGALPQLLARVPFPEAWRALLIFDPATKGLDGASEVAAFEALPAFPDAQAADLRARIAETALPALQNEDFESFCAQVGYLQDRMGAYFGPLQGGAYTSPCVGAVLRGLRADGVIGLGQSSWGPTGFAFAPDEETGQRLLAAAKAHAEAHAPQGDLRFTLARGRNSGADITVE